MQHNRSERGFTLLELLVVIAIIGVIAAVVVASISRSREAGRNAAVLSQIAEYEKALNYYYSDNGFFPGPTSVAARRTERCIGAGSSHNSYNGCWNGAAAANSYLPAALVPEYMPELTGIAQGELGSPAYNGCTNTNFNAFSSCTTNDFAMFFLLEGTNQDCGRYLQANGNYQSAVGDFTLCIMNLTSN